jgi:hypothetical protein
MSPAKVHRSKPKKIAARWHVWNRFDAPTPPSPPTSKKPPNAATTAGNSGPPTVGQSHLSSKIDSPKTGRLTLNLRRHAAQAR